MSPSSIFMLAFNALLCVVLFSAQFSQTNAWVSSSTTRPTQSTTTRTSVDRILVGGSQQLHIQNQRCSHPSSSSSLLFESVAADSSGVSFGSTADDNDDDEDDEDEWEEVEMEILTESDFYASEWLVGSVMDRNPNKIVETWVRLATDKDGKNVAVWGDGAQGTWSFDVANQFLSFSKQNIFGKSIWAGVVDDYYFTLGTIRGYNMWSAAAVLGQWQAKRLGVEPGEAGVAPWFEEPGQDQETPSESQEQTADESSSSSII